LNAHYKKWYKRGFFAILDMMLMNAYISWNASCRENPEWQRTPLKRHNFYWCISQRFLNYTENDTLVLQSPEKKQATAALANGHKPERASAGRMCAVCKTDWNLVRKREGGKPSQLGLTSDVARCQCCGITAHDRPCLLKRTIHSIAEWSSLTCFEIAHTKSGFDLWQRSLGDTTHNITEAEDKKLRGYNTKTSHPKYLELARKLGAGPKRRAGSSTASNSQARTPHTGRKDDSNSSSGDSDSDNSPSMEPLNLTNVNEYHNR